MNPAVSSSNWFVRPMPNEEAEIRLVLFPYAGGGPTVYGKWITGFDPRIEAFIAHYPGRGSRHADPPINKIDRLVEMLAEAIQPILNKPLAFFGHSFGGLLAFELAKQVHPRLMFISGCAAPHIPNLHPSIHHLPDPDFIKSAKELDGIPPEVANHSDLMGLLLPMLRTDFEAVESYEPNDYQLSCPILAYGGLEDPRVSREQLEGWANHTNAGFRSQYFPGDHFFIGTKRSDLIASINFELTSSHAEY